MNFDKAFEIIIGHEGSFTDDPRDRGNWTTGIIGKGELKGTKYGIASHAYPALDIYNLTLNQAKDIYKPDYWDAVEAESIPGAARLMVFDCAVNTGVTIAKKLLQRAVGTKDDGVIGPKTRAAISNTPDLAMKFAGFWLQYYTDLPGWPTYGKGWTRRVANDLRM